MITTASPLLRATALLLAVLVLNSPAAADPLDVSARWVPLDKDDPERKTVGNLIWRGGLQLISTNSNFEQLSALLVKDDGSQITSVTDRGYWVTVDLAYSPDGYLSGVKGGEIGRLLGRDGEPLDYLDRGAESLAQLPKRSPGVKRSLVVAFEQNHRLWHYSKGIDVAATNPPKQPEFKTLTRGSNDGVEALVTLSNDDLLAIVEGPKKGDPESPAYLLRDGVWMDLIYPHDIRFRPTGATRLPDDDVLVIERCFKLCNEEVRIRLRHLKAESIGPGKPLVGDLIAELKAPLTVDNLEGVAARLAESGETLVYLLSDDNSKPWQRTLLLMFALTH